MRVGAVSSQDLRNGGARLTGGFHLSEDQQAVVRLRRLRLHTVPLVELCRERGLFRGPIFKRIYATDAEHGVPYVSPKDLLKADVRPSAFLSRRLGPLLDRLRLDEGMIVITCSGMNLGTAVWVRRDIDGLCGTHDLIRVVPDPDKIPPGYLYAFLASRFGRAWIRKQIFGGNIKHVEPEHLGTLPVPRVETRLEAKVHRLVMEAAESRMRAAAYSRAATARVEKLLQWTSRPLHSLTSTAWASTTQRRLDAFHHGAQIAAARACLADQEGISLGSQVDEVFEPNRGARLKVEDERLGVPFLSSSEVFKLDPVGEYRISRRTPDLERLLVLDRDLLVPRSGQVGGIVGRAVLPLPTYYGDAASEHLVRIRCRSRKDALLFWALFASEPGYFVAVGTAYGSSIPSLDCELLSYLLVPRPEALESTGVAELAESRVGELTTAIRAEREAIVLVESALDEVTSGQFRPSREPH